MLRLAPLLGPWGRPDETPPKQTKAKPPKMNSPVSTHESRLCECGHTHYWHGDRAVALCGAVDGLSAPREESWQYRGPQCQCKGFRLAL